MSLVSIQYKRVVYIFAALRQIELSLDRARWDNWPEFQEYFSRPEMRLLPAGRILEEVKINKSGKDRLYSVQRSGRLRRWLNVVARSLCGRCYFKPGEIDVFTEVINGFEDLLSKRFSSFTPEAEYLRIKASTLCYDIFEDCLRRNDLKMAHRVDHFCHHEGLEVVPLSVFGE